LVHNGTNGLQANGANSFLLIAYSTIDGNVSAAAAVSGGGTYTYQTNSSNGNVANNGGFSATLPLR
jgi:hypothetical protein